MLPPLTDIQKEQGAKQLTTLRTQELRITDAATLRKFYTDWLDAFAEVIIGAACEKCIPPWLLAAIVLGEVTAMDTYLGIDERTLEEMGLGNSVGLAQITGETAKKYDLTPFTQNEAAVRNFIARKLGERWGLEAIYAELITKPLSELDLLSPPIGTTVNNPMVDELFDFLVRRELLNPILSIHASAGYLRNLIEQAVSRGNIPTYTFDNTLPWGNFDFTGVSIRPCPIQLEKASTFLAEYMQKVSIAKFFGGAHNDDNLGGFKSGYGLTQGENAGAVADDLIGFDLLSVYKLTGCP